MSRKPSPAGGECVLSGPALEAASVDARGGQWTEGPLTLLLRCDDGVRRPFLSGDTETMNIP